jgi:hypothetical protein
MSSDSDGSAGERTFELSCTDCSFETTVEGEVMDALDVAESHQTKQGESVTDHFVNFERRDGR